LEITLADNSFQVPNKGEVLGGAGFANKLTANKDAAQHTTGMKIFFMRVHNLNSKIFFFTASPSIKILDLSVIFTIISNLLQCQLEFHYLQLQFH
jgi:hypothetical protein